MRAKNGNTGFIYSSFDKENYRPNMMSINQADERTITEFTPKKCP